MTAIAPELTHGVAASGWLLPPSFKTQMSARIQSGQIGGEALARNGEINDDKNDFAIVDDQKSCQVPDDADTGVDENQGDQTTAGFSGNAD